MDYYKYIRSNKWKEKVKLFGKSECLLCGKKYNLHTHHRNYENLGSECAEDLETICSTCHKAIHFHGKKENKKIRRWQSGSELYIKARKNGWNVRGWKNRKKIEKFRTRAKI